MALILAEISRRGCLYKWTSKSPENNIQRGIAFRRRKEDEVPRLCLKHLLIAKRAESLRGQGMLKTMLLSCKQ